MSIYILFVSTRNTTQYSVSGPKPTKLKMPEITKSSE